MERAQNIYENARRKSTKKNIAITYKGETIKISKRKLKNLAVKAGIVTIALIAACKIGPTVSAKIDYYFDVKEVVMEQSDQANSLLVANDLHVVPLGEDGWCNDYSKIKGLSENDLYGLTKYCGYEEGERIVQALGYESWNNYLSMNGYFDKEGNPSRAVWENYEESRLVREKSEAKENGRNY